MSEEWAIALVGMALGALGWTVHGVAEQIKALNTKLDGILETMVKQSSCDREMGQHCQRLDDLEKKVNENTRQIAVIEAERK